MVKASEKEGHIQFTRSGCEGWVDLPITMIEKAEHLGIQPCKDHAHPVMQLTLKESKDPLAQILMALLSQSGRTASPPLPPHAGPMGSSMGPPTSTMDWEYPGPRMGDPHPNPYSGVSTRMAGDISLPGMGGGLNAWGCWKTTCCKHWSTCCLAGPYSTRCWACCAVSEPCERCIWPY